MGDVTGIEWTNRTWNPWQGCTKVSPGCKNCYMYREKQMYGQDPRVVVRSKPPTFNKPLSKKWSSTPALVFTCSWSDWFHEGADTWRDEAWSIVHRTPHLTYQILTKRPERMLEHLPQAPRVPPQARAYDWPWPNVWLGVSVENQECADSRIPLLLSTPARLRFLSVEPLLGPVDLKRWLLPSERVGPPAPMDESGLFRSPLHWVIVGGESGPGARPMEMEWVGSVVDQCQHAGVPVFVKQLGAPWAKEIGAKDNKGGDPAEWPSGLQVREMPKVAP